MFAPHLTAIFAAMGRPAVYAATDADPVPLRAIRQGGGQPVNVGPVSLMLERVRFEVLRAALPAPTPGALLTVDGVTWTIEAVQPVENDAHGLKWSLDAAWGASIVWRSVVGTGAAQSPPSLSGAVTVAADGFAGSSVLSLAADYAVGALIPEDAISIAGAVYTVTTTSQASAGVFAAIGISPPLAEDVELGAAAALTFARDTFVTAAISGYQARELQGGVLAGDLRLVLLPSAANALPELPKVGDMAITPFGEVRVENVSPVYAGVAVAAYDVQARR